MATTSHQNSLEHTATANDPANSSPLHLSRYDDSGRAPQELQRIVEARHHDPFAVLGKHACGDDDEQVCVYLPGAATVALLDGTVPMQRIDGSDFFTWRGARGTLPSRYRLHWQRGDGRVGNGYDPYCFPPQLADFDIHLFNEGRHWHAYRFLGAHPHCAAGVSGVLFATWAPNAARSSVVGDFIGWDGRRHPMRVRGGSGVWELFIPGLASGTLYKFELRHRDSGSLHLKTDPYGQQFEVRPSTASIVRDETPYAWQDDGWLQARRAREWRHAPQSLYEVQLGTWQRVERGILVGGVSPRRSARRCGGVDALSGLFASGRRLAAQHSRRQRKPRGHRLPAPAQRSHPRPISGHDDHGGGIHGVAHGVTPRLSRRSWLQHEVEHGLDARQPALYAEGRGAPPLSPRLAHVRSGVLLLGKFHPAFFPRRGGAWQGLLARPHAGRCVATLRQSAAAVHLHVYISGQKTIIHGRLIRSGARVEFRCVARLALA